MNFIKHRRISYILSLALVLFGAYNLIAYGVKLSVDFTGGTKISGLTSSSVEEIKSAIPGEIEKVDVKKVGDSFTINLDSIISEEISEQIKQNLTEKSSEYVLEGIELIQPAVGNELIIKTGMAVLFSVIVIFGFITYSFKDLWGATSAIIAMLHDTFILIGLFAFFGHFLNAEVDLLLITAVLTVLSFSLYDTIVIFDKIKEIRAKSSTAGLEEVIDTALETTMVRSVNNSLTSVLALYALILFVSGSLFWFSVALLIGVIIGTYSSPFVAANVYYDLKMWRKKR